MKKLYMWLTFILCSGMSVNLFAQSISINYSVSDYQGNNISCHGASDGSIDITSITGGTPPYAYSWNTGSSAQNLSSLPSGTYIITVTDSNNLSATDTIVLIQPNAIGISLTSQIYNGFNISVNGGSDGSINTTVTGGTTPYNSYSWSNASENASPQNLAAGIYTLTVTDANGCTAIAKDTLIQPNILRVDTLQSPLHNGYNVSCNSGNNGSIRLCVTGGAVFTNGSGKYHYTWSNGEGGSWNTKNVQNASAGNYTVQVIDANGNELDTSITLTQPAELDLQLSTWVYEVGDQQGDEYNVSCNGCHDGLVVAEVSGGLTPYIYHWNNGNSTDSLSNVGAGSDSVTITDANGCFVEDDITLTQPSSSVLQIVSWTVSTYPGGYNVSANGAADGSITNLIVIGGTPPYTYGWNTGATTDSLKNLTAGRYSLVVKDAAGGMINTAIILEQPNDMWIYTISPGYEGGYDISTVGGSDGSIYSFAEGGTPPYTFAWTDSGGTALDSAEARSQELFNLSAGTYTLTVTDADNNIAIQSIELTEPPPLHVDTLNSPTTAGGYNIHCNGGTEGSINLAVSGGTPPYQFTWSDGSFDENDSGLSAGTYSVRIVDNNGAEVDTSITLTQPNPLGDVLNISQYASPTHQVGQQQGSLSNSQSVNSLNGGGGGGDNPAGYQGDSTYTNISCKGCKDGTAAVEMTGGVAPYSYIWTYDIDCQQQQILQLQQSVQTLLTLNGLQNTQQQLSTGNQINSTPDTSVVYSRADSIYNLAAGLYTVVVIDANGCELSDNVCLTDDGAPNEDWSRGGNVNTNAAINFIGTQDSVDFVMRTNDTERVRVTVMGDVGIGTSTPQAQLDINAGTNPGLSVDLADSGRKAIQVNQGTNNNFLVYSDGRVFAREITVDAPGISYPDYVFAPGFRLRPLNDLEKYIKENKHLPDIPTATEADKGGLSIGQMQEKLLEKVEELSLYIIELNRKDIDLNKKVDELQRRNEELDAEIKDKSSNK